MCHTPFKNAERFVLVVAVVLALLFGIPPHLWADVVVEPPGAIVAGKTIAEWSTNWWRWAAALAPPGDPFTDTSGQFANVNQSGPVFLLAGSPGGGRSRQFEVPTNTYLLIPLLVGELSQLELGFGQTPAQIRQAAQQQANQFDSLHATLDGIAISQNVLFLHREASPDFGFNAVANNQVGIALAGDSGVAVADGYFLMIDPLPLGVHVLNYGGGASGFGISVDETDTIGVGGPPTPPVMTRAPVNQTVMSGETATFTIEANGAWPLNYQWYHNGAPLTDLITNGPNGLLVVSGARSSSLALTAAPSMAGAYWVVVSNQFGWFTSPMAFLTVATNSSSSIQVEPPGAIVAGQSIAAWTTNWWRWAAALAPPGDPFSDTTGQFANVNQSGPVFFLAGSPAGSTSRHFRIPGNTYILVPLRVGEWSQLELGFDQTAAQIRQAAQQQANQIDSLHATLDGVPISQTTLFTHRETSPDFNFDAVANNQVAINGVGNSGIAVADGYFLMLAPLAPGTHTLNYGGGITGLSLIDETDVVSVPPGPTILNFQRLNNSLVLTWTNAAYSLQSALAPNGPYMPVGADSNGVSLVTSPYTNSMIGPQQFFRLQAN